MARIRSSPRARVSAAKPAATARNGLTRPKYWTATPDRAGPTTPPAPALATVPPSPGPPGAASASQDSPAVQTTAKPIPNPSRAASKNGNDAGHRLREHRDRHQPAGPEREPARAEPVGQDPGRQRDGEGGEPGRAEHHALLDAGQAEPVGVDGKDRHHRVLGGGTGQDEPVDEEAEQPHRAGAAGGHLGRRPLQLAGLLLPLAGRTPALPRASPRSPATGPCSSLTAPSSTTAVPDGAAHRILI